MAVLDGDPESRPIPGTRFSAAELLLTLQGATSQTPRSSMLATTTDPLLPARTVPDRLAHLHPDLYDTRPESHLSRLLKVLLGDAGAGLLRKRYLGARLQSVLLTMRYQDLDVFYGQVMGLRRLSQEQLDLDPWLEVGTEAQWAQIDERDASYRARIESFSRALPLGGTPEGMAAAAAAVLGTECRVYETFVLVDENGGNPGGAPPTVGARSYGDVETDFRTYADLERGSYADVEGGSGTFGRTTTQNRAEFVVRPKRSITEEETYELTRVLSRLKPAGALLTIDPQGVAVHTPVSARDVSADSRLWQVVTKVAVPTAAAPYYPATGTAPVEQPHPVHTTHQGEMWGYNADVASVTSYVESVTGALVSSVNFERIFDATGLLDLTAQRALADPAAMAAGRVVSDAVMLAALYDPDRGRRLL